MDNILIGVIRAKIEKEPNDYGAYEDLFSICRNGLTDDKKEALRMSAELRSICNANIRKLNGAIIPKLVALIDRTLLFEAPHVFDSYMLYLEKNRRPNERFYKPRRKKLKIVTDAIQDLVDDRLDELFVSMPPRVGKAQPLDAKILTPNGFIEMGDIQIGDFVIGADGKPTKVVGIFPQGEMNVYRVTFSDGTSTECTENHLWAVKTRDDRRRGGSRVVELKDIMKNIKVENGKRYNYSVPYTAPVEFPKKELPIHPYVLGIWLGDGYCTRKGSVAFTNCEDDIINRVKQYEPRSQYALIQDKRCNTQRVDFRQSDIYERLDVLGLATCDSYSKFIPEIYLRSSVEDRLFLLQGLIDSDGYCVGNRRSSVEFSTISPQLRDGVLDLVRSLGGRITYTVKQGSYKIEDERFLVHRYYRMILSFANGIVPCSSKKHLAKYEVFSVPRKEKYIVDVKYTRRDFCQCIKVENEDGLYLTDDYIVTHNTTLIMFALTWIIGRNSELANLYSAYSDVITAAMYSGVLEVINDAYTYTWHEIFPDSKIVATNAKDEIINIDRKKRYPSLTCRSLYGTLNGACDCNGFLVSDDLIGGIEEALNKDRLASAWFKVDNNLIPRAKEQAKKLWVGTRWSIADPAGVRMDLLEHDAAYTTVRYRIINMPALDLVNDESNFEYDYGVGFSTDYYRQRRASFERNNDMASWNAQYMQEPIERDGTLFCPDDLRYYNGILPSDEPDRIFMAVDPAFGGGDFCSAPVCFQYGNDCYIPDVVFDAGDKKITQPKIVEIILRYKIQAARFEANNGGEDYQEAVEKKLREKNYRLNITSKRAKTTVRKEQRIFDKAPEIREFYFLEANKRTKEYNQFMNNLFAFKITGKNKNDDAPDSLAMLVEMREDSVGQKAEIFKRPF